jgi:biopolymer transport protein ExbD
LASQVFKRGAVTPAMNITPLIDVVFLLIIFFMLVSNIVAKESVQMVVPKLEEPKTADLGDIERVVVNIVPEVGERAEDPTDFFGEPRFVQIGLQQYDVTDLAGITDALRAAREANPDIEVLLRADAALFYDAVAPVMTAITDAQIVKVNLVAYLPDEPAPAGE